MTTSRTIIRETRAVAGNPAGASVSVLRYAYHYPKWPLLGVAFVAVSIILACLVSYWLFLLPLPSLLIAGGFWGHVRSRFINGDANVGLVIRVNPTLIAVMTDLRRGFGSYPAVKVIRTRLRSSMGEPLRVGMRLPTVAVYQRFPQGNAPYWWDFDPRPLECATTDRQTLQRVMASFTEEQRWLLEAAVREIPSTELGLYRLTEEGWKAFQGFSFFVLFRACQAGAITPAMLDDSPDKSAIEWITRVSDRMMPPRFTLVTGGVILLCLSGATGLAMHVGLLVTRLGRPAPWELRAVAILGGASVLQLLLGMVLGAARICRSYSDPSVRAIKRRRFILSVLNFTFSLTAERWAAGSPFAPAWLHPICEAMTIVGLLVFAKTVHSVLLKKVPPASPLASEAIPR